jgi:hypothetical protein
MLRKIINNGLVTLFVASITWFSVPASAFYNDQDSHLTEQERHRIYERQQANRDYNQNHQLTEQERHRIYEQNQANRNSQRQYGQNQYNSRHDSRWNRRCVYYKNHHRHVRNKRSCRR